MRRILIAACLSLLACPALAWNAAGHRLVAVIAWQQLSPTSRDVIADALARHPDHRRWRERAGADEAMLVFAEASTWPDDIRNDPRFHDETRDAPTPALPGLSDTARHKAWHYVDYDRHGRVVDGELEHQLGRLTSVLRSTGKIGEISNFLPWLIHLVADAHQPLHVGRHGDEGGNRFEIENPFNPRLPFTNLHVYWDDLPGAPWLRGKRLTQRAARLLDAHSAPVQGTPSLWLKESHALLEKAYPDAAGSVLPIVDDAFHRRARDIADRRLVDAGYRLGRLLDSLFVRRVSRETPPSGQAD